MNCYIKYKNQHCITQVPTLEDIPDFKDLRLIGRFKHYAPNGAFMSLQYAFYFPNGTFAVDLPDEVDWAGFKKYVDERIAKAGVKVKMASGTIQDMQG